MNSQSTKQQRKTRI